jgi:hypothetical protein
MATSKKTAASTKTVAPKAQGATAAKPQPKKVTKTSAPAAVEPKKNGEAREARVLKVLRALKKLGAVSATTAVSADDVVAALPGENNVGGLLYEIRHANEPLTARSKLEGVKKATYLTKAGLKLVK